MYKTSKWFAWKWERQHFPHNHKEKNTKKYFCVRGIWPELRKNNKRWHKAVHLNSQEPSVHVILALSICPYSFFPVTLIFIIKNFQSSLNTATGVNIAFTVVITVLTYATLIICYNCTFCKSAPPLFIWTVSHALFIESDSLIQSCKLIVSNAIYTQNTNNSNIYSCDDITSMIVCYHSQKVVEITVVKNCRLKSKSMCKKCTQYMSHVLSSIWHQNNVRFLFV